MFLLNNDKWNVVETNSNIDEITYLAKYKINYLAKEKILSPLKIDRNEFSLSETDQLNIVSFLLEEPQSSINDGFNLTNILGESILFDREGIKTLFSLFNSRKKEILTKANIIKEQIKNSKKESDINDLISSFEKGEY